MPKNFSDTSESFNAQKMIVIVRNPLDVILSFANLMLLQSHTLEPNELYHQQFPDWWEKWALKIAKEIADSHNYVIRTIAK